MYHTLAISSVVRFTLLLLMNVWCVVGCKSPKTYRQEADAVAYATIAHQQEQALDRTEPFTIDRPSETLRRRLLLGQDLPYASSASLGTRDLEPIEQWPDDDYLVKTVDTGPPIVRWDSGPPVSLTLVQALQVGARNSRDYQTQKESVIQAALRLDLERDDFRNTWIGMTDSLASVDLSADDTVVGVENTLSTSLARKFASGVSFATSLSVDLVKLVTMDRSSSLGLAADATVSIPLLRGSGRFVVTEPLTQAERNVVYAIYDFERFKRTFAVSIASDYLEVLQQFDQVQNAQENYKRLITSTRRARRLADAGRLPEMQVDQSVQDELRARDRWVSSRQTYSRRLDAFKILLGLPTDAALELDRSELERLTAAAGHLLAPGGTDQEKQMEPTDAVAADAPIELIEPDHQGAGPLEIDELKAIRMALDHRLDLKVAIGQIFDAQRTVAVAADNLRADLTLFGSAAAGERRTLASAGLQDAELRPEKGLSSVVATLGLPLERTAERNLYRNSLINLEQLVRNAQELEDQIKFDIRDHLRDLLESREQLQIQVQSVAVARRRVASTDLFLKAGRAEIRDLLEANEDLTSAQNALTSAVVEYRVSELDMQRDLGMLQVDEKGIWQEFVAEEDHDVEQ